MTKLLAPESTSGRMPTFADVEDAAARLAPHIFRTPLLTSPVLDERLGARLLFKADSLQFTGSFKVRGAFNRLLLLSVEQRKTGVVAWSSGNHGQAVAYAGRKLGIPVTIVMPSDAPKTKIAGNRRWGAAIVLYDRQSESREEIGTEIAKRLGRVIVPPFDDPDIIAGQGTAALEALTDARMHGLTPDLLLCCTGGGGLIAGCALAAEVLAPNMALHPVEPVGYDDTGRSIAAGKLVENDPAAPSICDALLTVTPGQLTFAINRDRLSAGLTVTDDQVLDAMRVALTELRLVVEAGGVASLAAALSYPHLVRDKTALVLLTGGNLDMATFSRVVGEFVE